MQLEKPKLFPEVKSFMWFVIILLVLISVRLGFVYTTYQDFIAKPFYFTYVTVITTYEKSKNNKRYRVLKVKNEDGYTFYTTTHKKHDFSNARLRLQIFPNESIDFISFLGTFYVKSKIKEIVKLAKLPKNLLEESVNKQHQNSELGSFYNAIFFATPLSKDLREKIAKLGVSHLVALSGFHLGILWTVVYGLLLLFYRPLQQKYFPYRYALFDVGLIAIVVLGIYCWFVGFPHSLLRAYAMVIVGWGILLLGMELLSFTFLVSVFLLLGLLFPFLLVSLSFWLSVAGVYYIFLLLAYTKAWNKWLISLVVIPLGIFVLMLPIVHFVFGVTNSAQLLSPLLSLIFIPFYPTAMFLHFIGWGSLLDSQLLTLFNIPQESTTHILPLWAFGSYVALSIGAIWYKKLFLLTLGVSTLYGIYIFSV